MNPQTILSSMLTALKSLPTLFIVVVVAIVGFAVGKFITKPVVQTVTKTVVTTVHDTTQIDHYIQIVLHDTVTPAPNIIQRVIERVVPAETVITYIPISVKDSSAFASVFLINGLQRSGDELSIGAVNLASRSYKHFAFNFSGDSYDIGTNSQGVWVLEHRDWFKWNGVNLGIGYNQGGYMLASTGVTFFRHVNLTGRFLSTSKPWDVELTYKILGGN